MESARCITRETKMISSSEDENQHFASKPRVKQKSSKSVLQNEQKSSRKSNSKYCHASYQTNGASTSVSECGSITSEDCPSTKYSDSYSVRALHPVKNKDCVPLIYARPISSCEINQSEIDWGNPLSIGPSNSSQSLLNNCKHLFSFSNDGHFASLPKKVSTHNGFDGSECYESPCGEWNVPDGIENLIPPPKSSKHFSDSFFSPNKVESSSQELLISSPRSCNVISNPQSIDKLNAIKQESFVPHAKVCDSNSFSFPDKTLSVKYDPVILHPRSSDSKPLFPSNDQTYCAAYETTIPPPKSCGSESFLFTDQTRTENCDAGIPNLKSDHINLYPFPKVTDFKTPSSKNLQSNYFSSVNQLSFKTGDSAIPSPKGCDFFNSVPINMQLPSAVCGTTIPAPKRHLGNFFPSAKLMDLNDQKSLKQRSNESFRLRSMASSNCDTDSFTSSLPFEDCGQDLNEPVGRKSAGIYTSDLSSLKTNVIDNSTDENISSHNFKGIPVCDINIPLLKTTKRNSFEMANLTTKDQNKLAIEDACFKACDIFPEDFIGDLIEEGSRSLNNSISEHVNNIPESCTTPLSMAYKANCITSIESQSDLLSIEQNAWVDQSIEKINSNDKSCLDNIDILISSTQNHLDGFLDKPKIHYSDYSGQSSTLKNSTSDLNELKTKSSVKDSGALLSSTSRKEFFKKQSKSIDSGLGFLSEENLTISSSDIPSEPELNILPFTCKEIQGGNLNTNPICYKEDYSASILSSQLDGYIASEKERIDNLIDQLIGI